MSNTLYIKRVEDEEVVCKLQALNKNYMKTLFIIVICTAVITAFIGCKEKGRYIDLNSGKRVALEKDSKTGYMVNVDTKKPVYIYVDTEIGDTLYGRTGIVINGKVRKGSDEKWEYDEDGFTYKDGEYKIKADGDAYKIKDGDYKKKVEKDGDVKIKDGDTKIKIDGETGEKKVKKDN